MLKELLVYLFSESISRVDSIVLTFTILLFLSGKYKNGILFLLSSGIIVALIEALLGF